jgi:hypothetical protein
MSATPTHLDWRAQIPIPQIRANGVVGRRHLANCPCYHCARLGAQASLELRRRIPTLARWLGYADPVLDACAPKQLMAMFLAMRQRVIARVEAGEMPWPPEREDTEAVLDRH